MGMHTPNIEYPEDLLDQIAQSELGALAREAVYVKLYERGHISSGRAAHLLGISRRALLDSLGRYNVSIFDEQPNLDDEVQNARLDATP